MRLPPVHALFKHPIVQRALLPTRGDKSIHKLIRYSLVSGVAVVISTTVIFVCVALFHLSGIVSNTLGAIASTPAAYELNRKWAWGKTGKSHLWREVVPFWALTLVGYLASTGTVQVADSMTKSHGVVGAPKAAAITGASLFAWGVVWIVKFIIFNKLVFVERSTGGAGELANATGPDSTVAGGAVASAAPAAQPVTPAFEASARAL
jgi:putative flippase GtrA